MNPNDDLTRWSNAWQQQPTVDVQRLQRSVRRGLWKMRAMVAWRWISVLLMVTAVSLQLLMPHVPWPQKVWAASLLVSFAVLLVFRVRAYRGDIWQQVSDSVPDLLRLTIKRKKVTIRLLWINFVAMLAMSVISLLVGAMWLVSLRLHWNTASWRSLVVWLVSISVVITLATLINTVALCRQRRRLRDAEALLSAELNGDTSA